MLGLVVQSLEPPFEFYEPALGIAAEVSFFQEEIKKFIKH